MSAPVVPVNVQVPTDATAPVVADLTVHAIRVAHIWRRDVERLRHLRRRGSGTLAEVIRTALNPLDPCLRAMGSPSTIVTVF